jgi:AraC-like DNA-binding protein
MQIAGRGEIEVWEGGSLWLLRAERERENTGWHAHHAIQLTFSLQGAQTLRTADAQLEGPAIAVAPDTDHAFSASGHVAFLFVEPESPAGQAISAALLGTDAVASVPTDGLDDLLAQLRQRPQPVLPEDEDLAAIGRRLIARIAGAVAAGPLDPRVETMIAYAAANLDKPLSLATATSHIGLSPSRLRHLFVAETGLAFKTYVLWLRIRRALEVYADGATLTDAAHEAGFADSAHLSRIFRRTFGVPAASLRIEAG